MNRKLKAFLEEEAEQLQEEKIAAIKNHNNNAQINASARLYELKRIKSVLMKVSNRDVDVFCMNCWFELSGDELGLFISEEDNKLSYFCPNCGYWEFVEPKNAPPEEETEETLENGPKVIYEYPKDPIIPITERLFILQHKRLLEEYQQKREENELKDFNLLFNGGE